MNATSTRCDNQDVTDDAVDLARLGGKAVNLVRLAEAGLPVPPFVVIPTDEYVAFLDDAGLHATIFDAVTALPPADASTLIRAAFRTASLRPRQAARLSEILRPLGDVPVAVRSSATAEDLADFSFAGQQDSFLDVRGEPAILAKVVECWSSAWTERAITYRTRNGLGHEAIAVAVVVQQLVDADASGVLFTANPLTGRRDESTIDAVAGLGEALVQGQVTPDSFVVDTDSGAIKERRLAGPTPSLSRAHVHALTALGRRIADLFGEPQDIEWVRVGNTISIVQSRAITNLFPIPPDDGPDTALWFSFGAVQGMLAPLTPLGRDVLQHLLAGAGKVFGRTVDPHHNSLIGVAGERLWIRLDGMLRNHTGRRLALGFLPNVEPSVARIIEGLADDPAFHPTSRAPQVSGLAGAASFLGRVVPLIPGTFRDPEGVRHTLEARIETLLKQTDRDLAVADRAPVPEQRLTLTVLAIRTFARSAFGVLLPNFGRIMGPSMGAVMRLRHLAAKSGLPDADALALTILRALPGNVTTEMDFRLWDASRTIRADAHSWGVLADTPPAELAERFRRGHLPTVAQTAITEFLADYGMRGVAEIDLGTPRWRDDPVGVLQSLQSYVAIDDTDASPRAVYERGRRAADEAVATLIRHSSRGDARQVAALAGMVRGAFGSRETPKFGIIRAFGLFRDRLDAAASDLVDAGRLGEAGDVWFLTLAELENLWAHPADSPDLRALIAARKDARAREQRRAQVPRVLLGDGRTFYEGLTAASGDLQGAGVSPGVAEGVVRVIHDPATQQLVAGEILVCVGTDPAWTPLFLSAAGLVTEVGGLMTHGSVVAREYGIPAVVGVDAATSRLVDGQRIRVDGSSGAIVLL